jgi:hypothetical protein
MDKSIYTIKIIIRKWINVWFFLASW